MFIWHKEWWKAAPTTHIKNLWAFCGIGLGCVLLAPVAGPFTPVVSVLTNLAHFGVVVEEGMTIASTVDVIWQAWKRRRQRKKAEKEARLSLNNERTHSHEKEETKSHTTTKEENKETSSAVSPVRPENSQLDQLIKKIETLTTTVSKLENDVRLLRKENQTLSQQNEALKMQLKTSKGVASVFETASKKGERQQNLPLAKNNGKTQ